VPLSTAGARPDPADDGTGCGSADLHLASTPMDPSALDGLVDLVSDGDVLVLSGAGLSTESGIPDYRGPSGAARPPPP
jgi:hypothetical protein